MNPEEPRDLAAFRLLVARLERARADSRFAEAVHDVIDDLLPDDSAPSRLFWAKAVDPAHARMFRVEAEIADMIRDGRAVGSEPNVVIVDGRAWCAYPEGLPQPTEGNHLIFASDVRVLGQVPPAPRGPSESPPPP